MQHRRRVRHSLRQHPGTQPAVCVSVPVAERWLMCYEHMRSIGLLPWDQTEFFSQDVSPKGTIVRVERLEGPIPPTSDGPRRPPESEPVDLAPRVLQIMDPLSLNQV
eukprot:TRINITY_DN19299_c0_g1_i1.p2 TRINITY_DN19299_c0_g1~~TRINITY_DN19299_c0_g1_i1.p2  ORF type:complete len:107 (+),score=3.60 TRINITY_DN19299_c0_g1_i1:366-686(+)